MFKKLLKILKRFITWERVLKLINSNRFRGSVIIAINWFAAQLLRHFKIELDEGSIALMATNFIYFIGVVIAIIGKVEYDDRGGKPKTLA